MSALISSERASNCDVCWFGEFVPPLLRLMHVALCFVLVYRLGEQGAAAAAAAAPARPALMNRSSSVATSPRLLELRHGLDLFPWLRPRDGQALAALEPVGTPWWHTVCTFAWPPQLDAGMTDGELAVEGLGGCVLSDAACVFGLVCSGGAGVVGSRRARVAAGRTARGC